MRTLFLSWQDPNSGRWFPVGRLGYAGGVYSFQYVRGAEQAKAEADFEGLISFPEWNVVYSSKELFPLFSNRVVPRSRPGSRST